MVIAIDVLGFGEQGPVNDEQPQILASDFYNLSHSLARTRAKEDKRTVDFLTSLPKANATLVTTIG